MGDTPTADEARASECFRFLGVMAVHANDLGDRAAPPVLNQAVAARQERANAEEDHELEPFCVVGANLQRSIKKATKATGGNSTKKATKETCGNPTKKVDKAAAPEEPSKDNAEGERYT
eukprot:jgi/Tetstr1/429412/TSEL_019322.t1